MASVGFSIWYYSWFLLFLLDSVLLAPFTTSFVIVTLSLAMKLSHTVVAAYMTDDAVVACLCHMGKAYVYLLFHGTVGSISVMLVLFLFIGGNCGKSIRPMMQTTNS